MKTSLVVFFHLVMILFFFRVCKFFARVFTRVSMVLEFTFNLVWNLNGFVWITTVSAQSIDRVFLLVKFEELHTLARTRFIRSIHYWTSWVLRDFINGSWWSFVRLKSWIYSFFPLQKFLILLILIVNFTLTWCRLLLILRIVLHFSSFQSRVFLELRKHEIFVVLRTWHFGIIWFFIRES